MPTQRGWTVAAAALVLVAAGALLQYRALVLLGALAAAAVAWAALVALWRRPAGVRAHRAVPVERAAPGDDVEVSVVVEADRMRGPVLLTERIGQDSGSGRLDLGAAAPARGGSALRAGYRLTPARRGVIELGPLQVSGTDPLGLASAGASAGGTRRLCVHPRWERLRALPAGAETAPEGGLDNGRSGTQTFRGLRDYTPGDDIRHVHWRRTARAGRLLVRQYSDTSQTRLVVLLDDRAETQDAEGLDAAAEAAACVAATALHHRVSCTLTLASGAAAHGRLGLSAMLDLLAAAVPVPGADLPARVRALGDGPVGGAAVLIGSRLSAADLRPFAAAGETAHRRVAAQVGPAPAPEPVAGVAPVVARSAAEFRAAWNEAPWTR
ncbi:DUF58 domain-containing protein [Streptomonospora sp. PA3]|uniref:DUF58 domain-containing protein n=1 Tax=Streptomonospora sp. PA3 TaxID=2607326 RepID=UPI0012DE4589|nr:DUF58 domain-containing protein [Streptomonospora sp. PA3]MUL42931.1 DUF58 domain-containing protein [Streptomonospora sp. PA3]